MNGRLYRLAATGNPLVQVISLLVFGVALIGAVLMGAVILAFVFGVAVIGAIVFSIRLWWLRRKLLRAQAGGAYRQEGESRLIDAEYTVITEREPQQPRPRR